MSIYIRVDSSIDIGTGHVMRCLTLADVLQKSGGVIYFICRDLPGNICSLIEQKGYKVHYLSSLNSGKRNSQTPNPSNLPGIDLQADAEQTISILKTDNSIDWLIMDHYALDSRWEMQMRGYVKKIMVIDDIADRKHECDLLLDQNLYDSMESRYDNLVPGQCTKLLGPRYALLRQEFRDVRKNLKERDGSIKKIIIFFGGADSTNETSKALEAIRLLNRPDIAVDVVVGSSNPNKEQIKETCMQMINVNYFCQVDNMAYLMADADLAIGAGGTTTWERCCVGLPAITIVIADNQSGLVRKLSDAGGLVNLGWFTGVKHIDIKNNIESLLNHPSKVKGLSSRAADIVDGMGTERVAKELFGINEKERI